MAFDFGFTARDPELLGGRRYADPLGIGPIWSNIARRLIPNLTAQSTRAEGFQLLLCGVDLYGRLVERSNGDTVSFRDFYVVLEQAFAHSTYRDRAGRNMDRQDCWRLPGSRAVRAASGNVKIGLEFQLLDAQLGGGTWGLYAAAAERSGLVTTDPPRLADRVREAVANGYRSPAFIRDLDEVLRCTLRGVSHGYTINKAEWTKHLVRMLNKPPHAALLRECLIERPIYRTPQGYPQAHTPLLAETARRLRSILAQEGTLRERLRRLVEHAAAQDWDREQFGDAKQIFTDILVSESFLAPITDVFDSLFACHGRSVREVADDFDLPLSAMAAAHHRFHELRYWSETARTRAATYGQLDYASPLALVESLVRTHGDVARARGRAPWLLLEHGKLTALIEQDPPEQPDFSPATAWRNSYYLTSLLTLAGDLDDN